MTEQFSAERQVLPECERALLLVDFINPLDFDGGRELAPGALEAARCTGKLRARLASEGVRVIYANDNYGLWQSNFRAFGKLDVLVNNAAFQEHADALKDISAERQDETVRTNVYGYFFMAKAALPHLGAGSSIINTGSVRVNAVAHFGQDTDMKRPATSRALCSRSRGVWRLRLPSQRRLRSMDARLRGHDGKGVRA
jgi:hypothetical protein